MAIAPWDDPELVFPDAVLLLVPRNLPQIDPNILVFPGAGGVPPPISRVCPCGDDGADVGGVAPLARACSVRLRMKVDRRSRYKSRSEARRMPSAAMDVAASMRAISARVTAT